MTDRTPRPLRAQASAFARLVSATNDPEIAFRQATAFPRRSKARLVEVNRITKEIYVRHGLSPDGDNTDKDESTTDDDLDIALMDYVQREWDRELERLLRGYPSALDS